MQLGIVNFHTESTLDSFQIGSVAVCGDLHAPYDTAGAIVHEIHSPISAASANEGRDDQLSIGVKPDPCPNVAPSDLFFGGADVLRLGSDIRPDFVALQTAHTNVADMFVMVFHAGRAEIDKELSHSIPRNSRHARRGTDAVALD